MSDSNHASSNASFSGENASRERFLAAVHQQPVDRPPVWVMRQAGRYLPEYRALKKEHSFLKMAQTPELATEVTLQPLRRFALDAAILFSDILVIPEALGQPYHFREEGGIGMDFELKTSADIAKLNPEGVAGRLAYVGEALKLIRSEIGHSKALLGFGGSPWTLATYMVEGGSSKHFDKIKQLAFAHPEDFHTLMEKLCAALVDYFKMQIDCGADAIQIFDSWAALAPAHHYEELSLRWIRQIISELPADFPIIVYAKGMSHRFEDLQKTGARVLGIDWSVDLADTRRALGTRAAVQGNLDPTLLTTTPAIVEAETTRLLESMRGLDGHIFNLGHGITPNAKIECMQALVDTVTRFR